MAQPSYLHGVAGDSASQCPLECLCPWVADQPRTEDWAFFASNETTNGLGEMKRRVEMGD